jgi:hypothetical protein
VVAYSNSLLRTVGLAELRGAHYFEIEAFVHTGIRGDGTGFVFAGLAGMAMACGVAVNIVR